MKVPQTSYDAFKQVHPDMKASHYGRIMSAMRILQIPSSMEAIAEKSGLELSQVARRVVELERDSIVAKHGKGKTSKGRSCYTYTLIRHSEAV